MAGLRAGLLGEIVAMSIDTLRASKMRSALTVLGVVIGITSIVGMEFSHYEEVPSHLHGKIIAAAKAERGHEATEEV